MGHYASEMTEPREPSEAEKAGFDEHQDYDPLRCPTCFALVSRYDWKKHRKWHSGHKEG